MVLRKSFHSQLSFVFVLSFNEYPLPIRRLWVGWTYECCVSHGGVFRDVMLVVGECVGEVCVCVVFITRNVAFCGCGDRGWEW